MHASGRWLINMFNEFSCRNSGNEICKHGKVDNLFLWNHNEHLAKPTAAMSGLRLNFDLCRNLSVAPCFQDCHQVWSKQENHSVNLIPIPRVYVYGSLASAKTSSGNAISTWFWAGRLLLQCLRMMQPDQVQSSGAAAILVKFRIRSPHGIKGAMKYALAIGGPLFDQVKVPDLQFETNFLQI